MKIRSIALVFEQGNLRTDRLSAESLETGKINDSQIIHSQRLKNKCDKSLKKVLNNGIKELLLHPQQRRRS